MRQAVRQVRRTQDFPVHLEYRPRAKVRLEDAFFHVIPAPPESEKVRLARVSSWRKSRARGAGIRGTPHKGLRVFDASIDACRWPDFYSHPSMIGPFETVLKLHALSNTLCLGRR